MRFAFLIPSLLLLAPAAPAQENPAPRPLSVYRLNFAVHEMEDTRRISTKNYSVLLEDRGKGVIRVGTKVPLQTGSGQLTYVDVGLNVDCRLVETDGRVGLHTDIDLSNVSSEDAMKTGHPVIRQMRSMGDAVLSPGKPTQVASLDDPATKLHFEIEVTATRVP